MLLALTRHVSPNINQCELTHIDRQPIDYETAHRQHLEYEDCLRQAGCQVISLPPEPAFPDSVFVEDTALVLDEIAVITRPGAASRRPETASIAEKLADYRKLVFIEAPAVLDGGDVLRLGKKLYVGLSRRSDMAAVAQLQGHLSAFGYEVQGLHLGECLHLKTAVTQVAENTLLINPEWVDPALFPGFKCIEIAPSEPFAANAVLVGKTVIHPLAFPETRQRVEQAGISVLSVAAAELAKAEGGVTCCSLIFSA
ncbi:MAG: dimethylargininase [Blastocatellia bacterium]|nr:dimethylargininase [Blastocatellia bacterium]